jgi:hypothetical protein
MSYSLATYEMSYNYLNDKTRNKQANKNDYHMWVVDSKENIKDNFAINNPDIKVVYKEWKELPKYYKDEIETIKSLINDLSKKEQIELFKMLNNLDNRCLQYSVLLNVLYGYEIKVGSLGIVLGKNKILWEFGNGLNESNY